jgi:hypothetical protein
MGLANYFFVDVRDGQLVYSVRRAQFPTIFYWMAMEVVDDLLWR